MSEPPRDLLEQNLERLSRWEAATPELWRSALEQTKRERRLPWWQRSFALPPSSAAAVVLVAIGLTIAVVRLYPEVEAGSSGAALTPSYPAPASPTVERGEGTVGYLTAPEPASLRSLGYSGGAFDEAGEAGMESLASVGYAGVAELDAGKAELDVESSRRGFGGRYQPGDAAQFSGSRLQPPPASEPEWGPRSIVRKATIELTCDDVRTAFAKASQLVSEARGEFVGQSALSGSDQNAYATLTLRVEAERLDSFLTELRALGTVVSENASGEDITTQVVDLDARLRNEQRVEQELLDLLASRQDAPLADVLKLRTSISDVRGSIERMQAQRLHLGRLTRLATVLLILRAKDAPPPAEHTLSEYFGNVISRAWTAGVHFLADTAGLIVAVVIGAAPWIVLAGLIYWLFRRRHSA